MNIFFQPNFLGTVLGSQIYAKNTNKIKIRYLGVYYMQHFTGKVKKYFLNCIFRLIHFKWYDSLKGQFYKSIITSAPVDKVLLGTSSGLLPGQQRASALVPTFSLLETHIPSSLRAEKSLYDYAFNRFHVSWLFIPC